MSYQEGLGRLFNVVASASGVHIPMRQGQAVTFVCFLDAGTQTVTLRESIDGGSEQVLPKIKRVHKGPGIGGEWITVPVSPAASAYTGADATNDTFVFTVGAEQLSDGFNCLEVTSSSGAVQAIIHELTSPDDPTNLARSVV